MTRVVATILAGITAAAGLAQERPLVFQVGSELVVLDLIATDDRGREVSDLARSEIQIVEDGSSRPVQQLQLISRSVELHDRGVPPATTTASRPVDAPQARVGPASLIVAVDLNSMPPDAMPRVTAAILETISAAPPTTPTMIVALTEQLEVVQPFTTDVTLLRQSLGRLPSAAASQPDMAPLFARLDRICGIAPPSDVVNTGIAAGQDLVTEANRRMLFTTHALAGLAHSIFGQSGRKHIVLYSEGYSFNLVGRVIDIVTAVVTACTTEQDMLRVRRSLGQQLGMLIPPDVTSSMRLILDRATRAQVSFYTVDPGGLTTVAVLPQQKGSTRGGRVPLPKFASMTERSGHDFLETLARDTGGRAFLDTSDLGSGLIQAQRDAESYYLVGYEPLETGKKGTFRTVRIATTRPNVTLRYRHGYYAMSERERANTDVEGAMQTPAAFRRDGFLVAAATVERTLQIDVRIPSSALRIQRTGATERATFVVHAELRSTTGKRNVRALPGKDVVLDLSPERMNAIRASDKVAVRLDSPAPSPGTYLLTVVARDSGGWIAADLSEIVVGR
jgi:VWFA-related protein